MIRLFEPIISIFEKKIILTIAFFLLMIVAKEELMLGSYPPQEATHEVIWPRHGWEEAPSGLLARGSYKSTIKFIDDDDCTHLTFDYGFSIKKDWGKPGEKEYVTSVQTNVIVQTKDSDHNFYPFLSFTLLQHLHFFLLLFF